MDQKKGFFFIVCFFLCSTLLKGVHAVDNSSGSRCHRHHHNHAHRIHPRFFVFGDSFADTGNIARSLSRSWKDPYGETFPGKPTGRFSDGLILTDFLASSFKIKSPATFKTRRTAMKWQRFGMNFAYGGTGVFNTLTPLPNMTTQIDFFEQLVNSEFICKNELHSSVALVTVAGNDYSAFLARNGSLQNIPTFIGNVTDQIYLNLKRIHGLGVRKVAVTSLEPLGCAPQSTVSSSYTKCDDTQNTLVTFHNLNLEEAVLDLNNGTKDSPFILLDLYSAFMKVFKDRENPADGSKFENPLEPCCMGISSEYSCGNVDANGVKQYTLCDNPKKKFYWDGVHPSHAGWVAVYKALQANVLQLELSK